MWSQWSQYGAVQPPLPMASAPPPPPAEPNQTAPPPQPAAQQPALIGPIGPSLPAAPTTPAPTVPAASAANATSSNPYSQYTAAQYAALTPEQQYSLQQHWQQWQKYQEEYAKWHAQYGEQYKREMEAATQTPAAPSPTAIPTAAMPPSEPKPANKITGQPQLYKQPPPSVGPVNQYASAAPAPVLQQQQHPPPPPSHQQAPSLPSTQYQQQLPPPQQPPLQQPPPQQPPPQQQQQPQQPPQWQNNTAYYNQPPPNFNPATAPPPGNYQNFKNPNTMPQNSYSTAPPPQGVNQMMKPPPFEMQSGENNRDQANIDFKKTGPPPNWSNSPNSRDNFGPNNNNRGRGPYNDNDQRGRPGPPNMPGNQSFNSWNERADQGMNNRQNDWQQRGPNNRGNAGPNDWSRGPNNRGNSGPNAWQNTDTNRPSTGGAENWDDNNENLPKTGESKVAPQKWQGGGGPNDSDRGRNNDWNESGNMPSNFNEYPANRGRNLNRNDDPNTGRNDSRERNPNANYSRDDGAGSDGRNSRGSFNRDDERQDGNNRFGGRNDGPNNRFNNRPNEWNDNNRSNTNRPWNDNREQNNFGNNSNEGNNRGNFGAMNNASPAKRSVPDIDEEMFDRQFKQWEEQFEDWKRANANHPDREMYDRYEKEFEKQRKRITERREQMRRRKMEQMGLNPNQPIPSPQPPQQPPHPPQPPNSEIFNAPPAVSGANLQIRSTDSPKIIRELPVNRENNPSENIPKLNEDDIPDVDDVQDVDDNKACDAASGKNKEEDSKLPITSDDPKPTYEQNPTPMGKRKSRFGDSLQQVNKKRATTSNVGPMVVISLDDDEEDTDNRNLEAEKAGASQESMTEIFKKVDGIPGLDLVEGASSADIQTDVKNEADLKTESDNKNFHPPLFEVKTKDLATNKIEEKGRDASVPVADISKSLNDPEFMKKISEALAKAQGKDDRQMPQNMRESFGNAGANDGMTNPMSVENSQMGNSNERNRNFENSGPNNWGNNSGPNNWGPNSGPNNWGQHNVGPNNAGPNNAGPNNAGPNNAGPNNAGPNNWMPNNAENNNWGPNSGGQNNWGPNNRGPNNNNWGPNNNERNNFGPNGGPNPWGPNNRGGNNWGPNGGGQNNWGPNNNGPNNWGPNGGGQNNNWRPNNGGRFNNNGPNNNSEGGPWGPNNNNRGPNNWDGPNGPNNNFGPNFRGNNNNNNNRNFGPNGPNGPDGNNFGNRGPNFRNNRNFGPNNNQSFGNNGPPDQDFGSQNQSNVDQTGNADRPRNANNPFRRGGFGGGENKELSENTNQVEQQQSSWQRGADDGVNLDYGDYYRPVQVIDYSNNANVPPKVIEYGHKPVVVSEEFKPVKVINYDHVTKVGKRAALTPLERQRRGQKRRNRRKQQREESFKQSGLGNINLEQHQQANNEVQQTSGDKEKDQLEDISDTDDLPNDIDERPESPAPPPPPMYSSGRSDDVFEESCPVNTSIFPSTAEANDNIPKVEVHHVQMSIPTEENNNTISIEEILMQPGRDTRPKKICIILRGPPGSGKSHVAKLIKEREKEMSDNNPRVLSIDDYFIIENDYEEKCPKTGKKIPKKEILYEYDKAMEETYMQYLIKSFKKTIADNFYDFIVIDCNNNSLRSLNEFYCHSKDSGYVPYIVDLFCELETCLEHNVHNRMESDIKQIIANWKPTPFHYIKLDVSSLLQNIVEMEDADDMAVDENSQNESATGDAVSQSVENDKETTADGTAATTEVKESDEADSNPDAAGDDEEDSNDCSQKFGGMFKSKWETDTTSDNLARLDGTSKLNAAKRKQTMEEYLQLDDWQPPASSNSKGKKRVRWADIEEKRKQEKMRAVGFVVGQTDWKRMMDPNAAKRALNKTKYIERVGKNKKRF